MNRSLVSLSLILALALAARAQDLPPPVKAPADAAAVTTKTPAAGTVRYVIGGDSRDDKAGVIPWAFAEAKERGAKAFIYLGDMELTPELDAKFADQLAKLQPVPFYPVLGNHEIEEFGVFRLGFIEKILGHDPEKKFRKKFLGTKETPVSSHFHDEVVYSVDLEGGLHFIALDNVSHHGFGKKQLAWLETELKAAKANPKTKFIIVGMHKALAKNGQTKHAMDEDDEEGVRDSDRALALFQKYGVSMIFASHKHELVQFTQGGIPSYITGGLGAPLAKGEGSFHHFLQLDVGANGLSVTVVKFEGNPSTGDDDDDEDRAERGLAPKNAKPK